MTKKIRIVSGRGTSIIEKEFKEEKWAGKDFQAEQLRLRSLLPKGLVLSRVRGTKSVSVHDYPTIMRMLSRKGYVISTAKGTALRVL
jgi:hypothetical protein